MRKHVGPFSFVDSVWTLTAMQSQCYCIVSLTYGGLNDNAGTRALTRDLKAMEFKRIDKVTDRGEAIAPEVWLDERGHWRGARAKIRGKQSVRRNKDMRRCEQASRPTLIERERTLTPGEKIGPTIPRLIRGPCRLYRKQIQTMQNVTTGLGTPAEIDTVEMARDAKARIRARLAAVRQEEAWLRPDLR